MLKTKDLINNKIIVLDGNDSRTEMSDKELNRILYFGKTKLYDYKKNQRTWREELRNISLEIQLSQLVMMFPDAKVIIPIRFQQQAVFELEATALLQNSGKRQEPDTTTTLLTTKDYTVIETTHTSRQIRFYNNKDYYTNTMLGLFKLWCSSPINTKHLKHIEYKEGDYGGGLVFRMKVPDKPYIIAFNLSTGTIRRISHEPENPENPTTIHDILEMNEWVNTTFNELATPHICIRSEECSEEYESYTVTECVT